MVIYSTISIAIGYMGLNTCTPRSFWGRSHKQREEAKRNNFYLTTLYLVLCVRVISVACFNPTEIMQQDNLSFPLICPDWNADEEILLLEVFSVSICSVHFWVLGSDWLPVIIEGNWNVWSGKLDWSCRACWYQGQGTMHWTLYNCIHELTLLSPSGNHFVNLLICGVEVDI